MEIILMRHGRPLLSQTGWIAPVGMKQWIECYNLAEVEAVGIPPDSLKLADSAASIVASTAPRSLSSVLALGHTPSVTDAVFCEAQLPFALWQFPRLSPFVCAAFFRLLWFFGYSRNAESLQVTKIRAKDAALKLVSFAKKGPALLVGHGIMNHLIAKELIAMGWTGSTKQKRNYWSASVYLLKI
jgi:hypothetical protein